MSVHYTFSSTTSGLHGVLCWEIFSLGKNPYPGLGPRDVIETLDNGDRLKCPTNAACTDDM